MEINFIVEKNSIFENWNSIPVDKMIDFSLFAIFVWVSLFTLRFFLLGRAAELETVLLKLAVHY
jgi:hypothetical protein